MGFSVASTEWLFHLLFAGELKVKGMLIFVDFSLKRRIFFITIFMSRLQGKL